MSFCQHVPFRVKFSAADREITLNENVSTQHFGEHLVLCGGNVEHSSTGTNELLYDTMTWKNEADMNS